MYSSTSYSNINTRNFALLADPALPLNYPRLRTQITAINGMPVDNAIDSLPSLAHITVTGQVTDENGTLMTGFNGPCEVVVFDKPGQYTTIRKPFTFSWQNSRLFSGTDSVRNGLFSSTFVVPLDISYTGGTGKVSLYASNDTTDAGGCFQNLYFGGTDTLSAPDTTPPVVEVLINDSLWVDGGITNPEPALYARMRDASGINTVRSSIGHELKATFNTSSTTLVLNDQFRYDPESYTSGSLRYRLRDYTNGTHTVTLQVWDNANNVSTASTTFTISDNNQLALSEILAYPNPTQGKTTFRIQSNRAERAMRVSVDIYTIAGAEVRHLTGELTPDGNVIETFTWNADTDTGAEVPKGIYLYRVTLTDIESGETDSQFQRIVVLR
jgi:FlgD Ig-like domain